MINSSDCPRIERSFLKICLFISASSETSQVIVGSTPFFRISKNPGATSEFKFKSVRYFQKSLQEISVLQVYLSPGSNLI